MTKSPEQFVGNLQKKAHEVKEKALDYGMHVFGKNVEMFMDVDRDVKENLDQLCEEADKGAFVVIEFNHQQFADAVFALPLVRYVARHSTLKTWRLPIAQSMMDGNQGEKAKLSFDLFKRHLEFTGAKPYGVIRDKDRHFYTQEEITRNTTESTNIVRNLQDAHEGWLIGPEGTLEGGRRREDDPTKVNGLQPIDPGVNTIVARKISQGKNVAVMSVAISGSYKVADPNTKGVPKEAMVDIFRNKRQIKVHVTTNRVLTNEDFVQAVSYELGRPVTRKEAGLYMLKNPRLYTRLTFVEQIAPHLPEDEKGIWGKSKYDV